MTEREVILVVDDVPENVRLLDAILTQRGYDVRTAASGEEALEALNERIPDLILLDVKMPGIDGYEVCRRIRANPTTAYLPVVMITAAGDEQKLPSIEAGADDFVTKPIDRAELLARVKSLLRLKQYHDTIEQQAAELAAWNRELEERVEAQVTELEQLGRLRRFLAPQLAEVIVNSGDESLLDTHRREITVVFCDLRGFTSFAETNEPEDVITVLHRYHETMGDLVNRFEGTLERFSGDGLTVFFNDPFPCPDPCDRAVRMAILMRSRMQDLAEQWARQGQDLALGVGIAQGFATLGKIGFEGRFDYAAIGTVTNLAARLCAEAGPWQILITQKVQAASERITVTEPVGDLTLRGFAKPVRAYNVRGLDGAIDP